MKTEVRKEGKKENMLQGELTNFRIEWNKIIWPEKTEAMAKTGAVIAASLIAGTVIAVWDVFIQYAVNFLA